MPPSIRFRHDVNGLRAIAVLLVVFYHFSIPGFSGDTLVLIFSL